MSLSKNVQQILNATISSLTTVIPLQTKILAPSLTVQPYEQKELSVLIGLVGDIKGRVILDTTPDIVNTIGQAMFGMTIEGEMIESFTGELGNMVVGNLCTTLEKEDLHLDISPPTVMTGTAKISGFRQAFKLPVQMEDGAIMHILLTIDKDK
ncbi:chemotaxis protein CheX [Sporosarcina ureilytica]|uniref:Chemotaxis protein CheX n=1 Tax=Sporosarcina ureilytica TaxID=298596 RepID=A0A1D8JGZ1_9BACL|nr:chemotaxis protein CheX [Sporosarcina ureilytica]AOV07966.1 chemotaxis protein CheX [Sporosarcina ureilytica]